MKRPAAPIIVCPSTAHVPVYDRTGIVAYAWISPSKVPLVEGRRFHRNARGYVVTHGRKGEPANVQLARLVTGAPVGMEVDHIDHCLLDNRDRSLRVCTHAQNMMNHPGLHGRARGVRQMNGRSWHARIMVGRVDHHLGAFPTKEEAIAARRAAEIRLRGSFAPEIKP